MKKTTAIFVVLLWIAALFPAAALASAAKPALEDIPGISALLVEADSGKELWVKGGDTRVYPASTTKIMTALLVLESGVDLDETITVGSEVSQKAGSSMMGLVQGQSVSYRDLLYGMLMVSGNDAASAAAQGIAGSQEAFVSKMNEKAAQLGMSDTRFENAHGVQDEGHYTTARDFAKLAIAAVQNQEFMSIAGAGSKTVTMGGQSKVLYNTNKLLSDKEGCEQYHYAYATGLKTGMTPVAQNCLAASAEKDGVKLIALIFGDQTQDGVGRWASSAKLFDYGFDNVVKLDLSQLLAARTLQTTVANAAGNDPSGGVLTVGYEFAENSHYVGTQEDVDALQARINDIEVVPVYDKDLVAPILSGDELGSASFKLDDEELLSARLVAQSSVYDASSAVGSTDGTGADVSPSKPGTPIFPEEGHASLWWLLVIPGLIFIVVVLVRALSDIKKGRRSFRARKKKRRSPRSRESFGDMQADTRMARSKQCNSYYYRRKN